MKYINNYTNLAAYAADTNRPTTLSSVSNIEDGSGVKFDGKNVVIEGRACGIGDICIFDTVTQTKRFIKLDTYNATTLPSTMTVLGVVYYRTENMVYLVSKANQASTSWAAPFKAKLSGFDFSTGGSFTITVNSTTTGTITYTTSDTLSSIATLIANALTTAGFTSALGWAISADVTHNCIVATRSYSTPTISTFTAYDSANKVLSTIIAIDKQSVSSGLITPYGNIYRKDGYSTYFAGLNFYKFYDYYYNNGTADTNQIVGASTIVKFAVFDATNNPLLVAYYGSGVAGYTAYITDKMLRYPYSKGAIISDSGQSDTQKLAASTYVDIDGSTKPYYPAAYNAFAYGISIPGYTTGLEVGAWWMPSVRRINLLIKDRNLLNNDSVNRSLAAIGGNYISVLSSYCASTEYGTSYAGVYNGGYGIMTAGSKSNAYYVRSVTAFQL